MAEPIEVDVKGLIEAQQKVEQTIRDARGTPMHNAFRSATLLVQRDAKKLSPVNTGRLRASIMPELRVEGNTIMGVVGSSVLYAPFMEFGTGTPAGHSPHVPPMGVLSGWAARHGMTAFAVWYAIMMRGGLVPRRYLQQAFEDNREKIVSLIEDAADRIVKK